MSESTSVKMRQETEHACVESLVSARAASAPEALAVAHGDHDVLTYGELEVRANEVACHLRGLGVGPDVVVALCLERSLSMIVGALGIFKAGGAYLPVDIAWPVVRLESIIEDAQAKVLLTTEYIAEMVSADHRYVIVLNREGRLTKSTSRSGRGVLSVTESQLDNLAYVIYTSGSTGQPKGVEVTRRSLLNLMSWHQHAFVVTAADRATQLASPAFDAAIWELWPHLTAGASIHIVPEITRSSPELLRDWLVAQRITISFVPTPLADRLIRLKWPTDTSLRLLLTGADTLYHYPPHGLPFQLVNNYGPTEATVVATSGHVSADEKPDVRPSIGRPIPNTSIYILDEHMCQVPGDSIGELYVGGAGVARGYRNEPELTAQKFIPDPFNPAPEARLYRTGDLGRFLADGQIAFVGRTDELLKIRGFRVEPNEIVVFLNRYPGVEASVVVSGQDSDGNARLLAYIVNNDSTYLSATDVRAFLHQHLPDYLIPSVFIRLRELPLTSNGKIDRTGLPAPDATNTLRDQAFVAPRTAVEECVAEIVASLLCLERVGVNENFFLLGGHSLLGAQLVARVRDRFGVDLPLLSVFDTPTPGQLAQEIETLIVATVDAMSSDEIERALYGAKALGDSNE